MESILASVPGSVCSASSRRRRRQKPAVGSGGLAVRCNAVLKQHKTRLYILGRCVSMLLCWHDQDAD
ncbi:hypothetical protein HU200_031021 [Digitaria exilis]|uniref:DEVIL-like protein n=1 Tax=Digitaria exilis TaxID=1010633 RepID=A0A835BQM7_9POAL|nr:hypothetical protein HU200_031021 [Digitaria exilis]CAB3476027.1 unnamed protein product [Digitaria exilis]